MRRAAKILTGTVLAASAAILAARVLFPLPAQQGRLDGIALPPSETGPLARAMSRQGAGKKGLTGIAPLQGGAEAFAARILLADAAVSSIDAQYYIWHNDLTWHTTPSFAAVLRAVEIPPVGGDTLWADMGAAYDLLPDDLKARIDPLLAEHDWMQSFGRAMPQEAIDALRPQFMPVQHPVVRVIPDTGRRVLFVNMAFTQRIVGVSEAESNTLLTQLYRHVQRPELQVRLRWQPNTVAMWDNRTCQHYAASDYYPARRVMDRISIVGDRPVGIAARSTA